MNTVEKKLVGVQGIPLQLHGTTTVQVKLQNEVFSMKVIVADQIATHLILGRGLLRAHQCIIEMGKNNDVLRFKEQGVAITIDSKKDSNLNIQVNVVLDSPLQVAPHSEIEVMGRVPDSINERTWIVEGQVKRSPVLVARAVVKPQNGRVPVRLLNTRLSLSFQEYFEMFFTPEVWDLLVLETNRYADQVRQGIVSPQARPWAC